MHVLIILTNSRFIGDTQKETGFHFSEFTHPYEFFKSHGYEVTVASPNGGECFIISPHPEDKINATFFNSPEKMKVVKETVKLGDLLGSNFDAIFVAGGHGTMFDLPGDKALEDIINDVMLKGGVLGAVCHGPAAFVGVKDKNGKYIVGGKKINSFTNVEEKSTPFYSDMPFLLESKLIEQGAKFESSEPRQSHLAVDSNIVSGQNPESIELVVGAIHALLQGRP